MTDHTSLHRLGREGRIHTVVLKDGLLPDQTKPRLYHVTYDPKTAELTVRLTDKVTTEYAAVNGIQNDLDRATVVMLDKVMASADLRRDLTPKEFTLFHVPERGIPSDVTLATMEKLGKTTEAASKLSKVMEDARKTLPNLVWSVHSRGATVFNAAVRDLLDRKVDVRNQCVAVYGSAGNHAIMRRNLKKAEIPTLGQGFYNHPFDVVPQVAGLNTINPVKIVGSLLNTPALFFPGLSPHTWHPALKPRDYSGVSEKQWEVEGTDLRLSSAMVGQSQTGLMSPDHASVAAMAGPVSEILEPSYAPANQPLSAGDTAARDAQAAAALLAEIDRETSQRVFPGPSVAPSQSMSP